MTSEEAYSLAAELLHDESIAFATDGSTWSRITHQSSRSSSCPVLDRGLSPNVLRLMQDASL